MIGHWYTLLLRLDGTVEPEEPALMASAVLGGAGKWSAVRAMDEQIEQNNAAAIAFIVMVVSSGVMN